MAMLVTWWLAACGGDGALEGVLVTADATVEVHAPSAWYWWEGGGGVVYVASAESASCEDVAAFLSGGDAQPPDAVLPGPDCNFLLVLTGWTGGSLAFDEADNWLVGFWNADCAMGEGSWTWEENDEYSGYAWTGREWTGVASEHETSLDPRGDDIELTATLSAFEGNYIDDFDDVPAEGPVAGTVRAAPCEALREAPIFP